MNGGISGRAVGWCSLMIIQAAIAFGAPLAACAQDHYALQDSLPSRVRYAHLLRPADGAEAIPMSITLRVPHRQELEALLAEQQRPGSPEYGHWLTPQEFADRFAPSRAEYEKLAVWLERQGFAVQRWTNRLRVDFGGTVRRAQDCFGVRLNEYEHHGRKVVANENAPLLPRQFAEAVAIARLDTFPLAGPLIRIQGAFETVNTMAPADMRIAYNVRPVIERGIDGTGQTIAIVARSDFDPGDVTAFQQRFGLPVREPTRVFPGLNPGIGSGNGVCRTVHDRAQCMAGEKGEVLLDTEWANAMAPGARVLVDIGADIDKSLADIVNNHTEAKVVSMSFGACERLDGADLRLFGPLYAQAATQGQTVLVAAGDSGSDGCQDGFAADVNVLASDAHVISVGGTALDPGFDATGTATGDLRETVWNDADGATGGGVSKLVPKPSYQNVLGVPADGFRDQPDVSLLASPGNVGYVTIVDGEVMLAGGTSAAAPGWAGVVALLNKAAGIDGSGALNAALYALGRQQYAEGGDAVFHDITVGNITFNGVRGFQAGVGFDLASGLGTPNVDLLARNFERSTCTGDCNGDRTVSIEELITGVNIALGALPLSQCRAFDANGDGQITIDELVDATNRALNGC